MATIQLSLDSLASDYPVFEPDQVLTDTQLNGLAQYLDDQGRLTRVELLGVGIAGGLRVKWVAPARVTVSRGAGVTTDGDLLVVATDRTFDWYKPYDASAPQYLPFYVNGQMITAYELLDDPSDVRSKPLSALAGASGMVVVMLMESYQADKDLCSGTDCDNRGKDAINTARMLLLSAQDAARLLAAEQAALQTSSQAATKISEVLARRVRLNRDATNLAQFIQPYRDANAVTHQNLVNALPTLWANLASVVGDLFVGDPSPAWIASLVKTRDAFANLDLGYQYYYDYLIDLAETWNSMRELLYADDSVLCPNLTAFSKHLVLGGLADPLRTRTGRYPSPLVDGKGNAREHVRFLAWKLHSMINSFAFPSVQPITDQTRLTPSRSDFVPLEERAIPYYYTVRADLPIHRSWNFRLSRRGEEARNQGYRADVYSGLPATTDWLNYQVSGNDFIRVEGHIGSPGIGAIGFTGVPILDELPFSVAFVFLNGPGVPPPVRRPTKESHLHDLHLLMRKDVDGQLDRAASFSDNFQKVVGDAVARGVAPASIGDKTTVEVAAGHVNELAQAVTRSRSTLAAATYDDYRKDPSWKESYRAAVDVAGQIKSDFGHMVRDDHATTLDTLIADNHVQWLDWLDTLIDSKAAADDGEVSFASYFRTHPGLEHRGGVPRGGTLVLLFDDQNRFVGDLALPYFDDSFSNFFGTSVAPPLVVTPHKPDSVLTGGYRVVTPIDTLVTDRLDGLHDIVKTELAQGLDVQKNYVGFLKDSVSAFAQIASVRDKVTDPVVNHTYQDAMLGVLLQDTAAKAQQVDSLRGIVMDPGAGDAARAKAASMLKDAEGGLGQAIATSTGYVVDAKLDTTGDSDGARAMSSLSQTLTSLNDADARKALGAVLAKQQGATSGTLQVAIGGLQLVGGFR